MAMNKILLIHFLIMFRSLATFGQDVIGFRAESNDFYGVKHLYLPENIKPLMQKNPRVISYRIGKPFRADSNMPIVDLPKDFPSDMPIKKLPKNFPSDMPIRKLSTDPFMPNMGERSPEIEPLFRPWKEKGPYIYRNAIPKFEAP